jgi:spermidine/putrescine transport system substrate-binding protein
VLNRRQLLEGGAGLALGAALGGCGLNSASVRSKEETEKVVKAKVDGDLVYFNWAEYLDPELIEKFEKRYGVRVRQSNFDSQSSMMAKLRAGNRYDVIFPDQSFVPRLLAGNQLLRIDADQLKNRDKVWDFFDDPVYDPNAEHTLPYGLYATGIIWNEEHVADMTGSWNDLFREDVDGKIYVLDDYQEAIGMANLKNGFALSSVDPDEIEQTKQTLIEQKPLLRGYSTDDIQNMINGNAWIHHGWNGDVINLRNQVKNPEVYRFEKPSEGFPVGTDTMAIPVNAEHPGTALLFIDFMLEPENAAQNIAYFGYPMAVTGAEDAFAEIAQDDPAVNLTVKDVQQGQQFEYLTGDARILWDDTWTEVRAA